MHIIPSESPCYKSDHWNLIQQHHAFGIASDMIHMNLLRCNDSGELTSSKQNIANKLNTYRLPLELFWGSYLSSIQMHCIRCNLQEAKGSKALFLSCHVTRCVVLFVLLCTPLTSLKTPFGLNVYATFDRSLAATTTVLIGRVDVMNG